MNPTQIPGFADTLRFTNTAALGLSPGSENMNTDQQKNFMASVQAGKMTNANSAPTSPTIPSVSTAPATTSPVITASAAQDDYNQKYETFKNILNSVKDQTTNLSQAKQYEAEKKAADDLQTAKLKLDQQGVDIKKAEIDAKNKALGLAAGSDTTATNTSGSTTTPPPQGGSTTTTPASQTGTSATPSTDATQTGLNSAVDTKLSGLADIQTTRDTLTSQTITTLQSLMAGTIPLTGPQQALITSLQNQLATNVANQTQANNALTGTVAEAGFRSGGEYTPEQYAGEIHNAVSTGVAKIQALDDAAAKTVADLEQSFQKDNFDIINKQFDILTKSLDDKATAIKDIYDTVTKSLQDQRDQKQKVTDAINNVALEAAKNGATPAELAKINASPDESSAIAAAGDRLQTATGTLGDYLQYKRDTVAKGLVPTDYQTYKDAQDAKTVKLEAAKAYATQSAKNLADANSTASDKVQQKLEQQYRQVLSKEFSSRTGSLGIENGKVNQANHLNSLLTQYYDPKTGNYNIPTAQYAELVMGLANLISPNGATSDADRQALMSKTASGDLKGAIQYITGTPQNGNTQDIIKNLVDSVDRQAETATRNREAALQDMRDQAPTDLEQSRIDKLNKSTEMVKYEGQDRLDKSTVDGYVKSNPADAENIAKMYEIPGATDSTIAAWLKANGKI